MRKMLFGGALMCAGLPAVAQVSGVALEFEGLTPEDNFVFNAATGEFDSIGNESFSAAGGVELLPYAGRLDWGIPLNDPPYSYLQGEGYAEVSATGSLSGGELWFSANARTVTEFTSSTPGDAPASTIIGSVTFTLGADSPVSLVGEYSGISGVGSGFVSVVLAAVGSGSPEFEAGGGTGRLTETFEFDAVLPAGEYELVYSSIANLSESQIERAALEFDLVVVPAPPAFGMLALGGVVAARRRHRSCSP
ncbi:MAG: hypothetical protein AAGJ54_11740 [Planctomycetota bacterium]